ncbi:MAG TPA: TssQ family T6SS-associated lipoprotein [Burkholderiales bacterium]|nr:TssQ family T6SS-associated lipoprotein [Burkholderiales bacterium]
MPRTRAIGWLFASLALLGGCQTQLAQEFPLARFKAETTLDRGIRQYDDGDYRLAARTIQGALDAGLTTRSQARAHKYLAFIHCTSSQTSACRNEFRLALLADPRTELKAEEAGHPIWGPVFRSVKAGKVNP